LLSTNGPSVNSVFRASSLTVVARPKEPARALALLDDLDLDSYLYFHSTRADFLRRLGRADEARAACARVFQLAETEPERRFLQTRLTDLTPPAAGD
jgi:RNA polymerase sigma-70 factor, ECF subfamily